MRYVPGSCLAVQRTFSGMIGILTLVTFSGDLHSATAQAGVGATRPHSAHAAPGRRGHVSVAASTFAKVAAVGGLDRITQTHIESLLRAHGIPSYFIGSVMYDLEVPSQKVAAAVGLLTADAAQRRYTIRVCGRPGSVTASYDAPTPQTWQKSVVNKPWRQLIQHGASPRPAVLVPILSAAAADAGRAKWLAKLPWVREVRMHERQYLNGAKPPRGYEAEVDLGQHPIGPREVDGSTCTLRYQVFGARPEVWFQGGMMWWPSSMRAESPGRR